MVWSMRIFSVSKFSHELPLVRHLLLCHAYNYSLTFPSLYTHLSYIPRTLNKDVHSSSVPKVTIAERKHVMCRLFLLCLAVITLLKTMACDSFCRTVRVKDRRNADLEITVEDPSYVHDACRNNYKQCKQ